MTSTNISPLRGLLEVTRLLRAREDLPELLDAVSRTIGETLGFRTVAVHLHRPAWDDFEIVAVHGNDDARRELLGSVREGANLVVLLAARFERRGAYYVPKGSVDWNSLGPIYTPPGERGSHADAWDPLDALLVPMRDAAGKLLGTISVDEPVGGRVPNDEELDLLVAMTDHAALAVEEANETRNARRHQRALEELLDVSSRITGETSTDEILRRVCDGIRTALDFDNVCAALVDPDTGALVPKAVAGWTLKEMLGRPRATVTQIEALLGAEFEREGCFLLTHAQAHERLARDADVYPSQLNGRGPWAWNRHWLLVPLRDGEGAILGVIWVDNPRDRLLPSADRLQALRIFANDAAAALVSGKHLGELRFLADHDPLTRLLNRRAFVSRLDGEVARATRYGRTVGLVIADLDRFKHRNDRFGHAAGDDALVVFSGILARALRRPDAAFRIGGDEFAMLLAETTEDGARIVVERIGEMLGELEGQGHPAAEGLTASFGFALCPPDADDAQTLFRLADEALYEAKRAGEGLLVVAGA
ncbi:MAG TPA: diguanylate cyclase [Gaiellaceae bacterium]|jgi:diguanylate cyclase (GGDEF)-like protein